MPKQLTQAQVDKELIDLKEMLEKPEFTADMLRLAAEGAMLRMMVVSTVFKRRFPAEHAKWENEE